MASHGLIFAGIKGTVLALDGATGTEVWRASLKGSDFVNVALVEGDLYATTKGELFALDTATGTIKWHNPLRGLGWGIVTIATTGQSVPAAVRRRQEQQAAAAAAGAAGASS